jgi:hypothetical protein
LSRVLDIGDRAEHALVLVTRDRHRSLLPFGPCPSRLPTLQLLRSWGWLNKVMVMRLTAAGVSGMY